MVFSFWSSCSNRKGSIKQSLYVLLSFCLFRHFLGTVSLVFSEFWHGARNPYARADRAGFSRKLCMTELDFQKKNFLPKKVGKLTKNGLRKGFEFIEKFGHLFLLNLFYSKSLYYFLCSYTNPYLGKFVLEIWVKIFSANQIAGFFNQSYLQNKLMN